MNKVICDVCGTAYPETSSHCPICGCAKKSADRTAAGEEEGTYAYVKGGRFSKKNVRKRASGEPQERVSAPAKRTQEQPQQKESRERENTEPRERRTREQPEEQNNTGLIMIVIFLLIAIVAVVIYIGLRVFGPTKTPAANNNPTYATTEPTDPTGTEAPTGSSAIPCEDLLIQASVELIAEGDVWALQAKAVPENTTEIITYKSADTSIVTVDAQGNLTAVAPGTTTVEVTCGSVTKSCTVICNFVVETEPTEPPVSDFTFEFNTRFMDGDKWDITLKYGDVWTCYKKDLSVDPGAITWTSDNPEVCTIQNGVVTIIGPGKTEIHAQYAGKTFTCIVRTDKNSFPNTEDTQQPGGDTEPDPNAPALTINKTDVTIAVGESFTLTLKDASGNVIDVTWTAENAAYATVNGNKITGAASGTTNVSTTHEGVTYTCVVRVK